MRENTDFTPTITPAGLVLTLRPGDLSHRAVGGRTGSLQRAVSTPDITRRSSAGYSDVLSPPPPKNGVS